MFETLIGSVLGASWMNSCSFLAQAMEAGAAQEETTTSFFESGSFMLILLVACLALAIFLAKTISSSLRMPEYAGKLSLIFGCILVAALLVGTKWPPKFGVDLSGGVNMVGSLNLDAIQSDDVNFGSQSTTAKDIVPNLLRRVDPSGTREIMIRPLGDDKIEVTIPTDSLAEADEIWDRLVKTGKLQFLIMAETRFPGLHRQILDLAKEQAANGILGRQVKDSEGTVIARWYNLARVDGDDKTGVLPIKMVPPSTSLIRDSATGQIVYNYKVGNTEENAGVVFANWWGENQSGTPQILLVEPTDETRVEGKNLTGIRSGMDEVGMPSINFGFDDDGALAMGNFTSDHSPNSNGDKYRMTIVLDNHAHTAPTINEAIYGSGRITGNFSQEEVQDLIINLRSGKIDVALNKNPISKQFIESELGEELKSKGIYAISFSLLLVLVFMIIYYRFCGIVATLALLLNLLFIIALVMAIQQPLTLTGLAGLVLTVGMSVDANVLIFERIREELNRGAALRMAIRNGFDKATTTIVDANVTTLITAIVLYVIGTEQIKGFAVTLILGILMSMFTAIYCSRAMFDIWERKRWLTSLGMAKIVGNHKINFLGKRALAGLLSVVLIGTGIAAMFLLGPKILNHDLRGGSTIRVVFDEAPDGGRDAVLAELPTDFEVNGENIEFSVSKLVSTENPDCVYKIDSNLPVYDGEGEAPYEELDDLLSRVFAGKLSLLHVDVADTIIVSDAGVATPDTSMVLPRVNQFFSAMSLMRPYVLLTPQEETPVIDVPALETPVVETPAVQTPVVEAPAVQTPVVETPAFETPVVEAPAVTAPAVQADPPAGATQETEESQFGVDENTEAAEGLSSKPPQAAEGAIPGAPRQLTAATDLKFKFPIGGKALRTLLIEAARVGDIPLEDSQLVLKTPDAEPGESTNGVMSKTWTAEMRVPNKDSASSILNNWAGNYNDKPYFPTLSGVGGQIARETQFQALAAIIASLLGIIAYVWIRFQNVAFGLAAVVALIHDVLIVLGAIAISHFVAGYLGFIKIEEFKISLPIVAALLTIIGYSLNDTIVVFDRIREVRGKRPELNADIVNTSISQTLSRTILTSLTTFIVVFILYWFGGDAIHGFAFSLVIGVIVGTYSSIFVASPVLLWLMNRVGLSPGEPGKDEDGKLATQ